MRDWGRETGDGSARRRAPRMSPLRAKVLGQTVAKVSADQAIRRPLGGLSRLPSPVTRPLLSYSTVFRSNNHAKTLSSVIPRSSSEIRDAFCSCA
jgi:hypothetical protein